uniref:ESPR-type extended signal peptide-containing protein n=1 Tax=Acinetobacter haemolyticus TaxID=29430 RepID=UPI003F55BEF2
MNKVYKVVWNASLGVWVAVSELAKGRTKKTSKVQAVGVAVAIIGVVSFSPDAFAGGYSAGGGYINSACNSSSTGASGQTGAIAIGGNSQNPCASQPYTIAIGNNAKALSQGSIAIGSGAYADSSSSADGTGAVAIGNDAVALGKNSFALGAEASVTTDNTVSFGHAIGDDRFNNGTKVGTWTTDRFMRLANVANGYKNNDAVNVSQIIPLATALGTTVNSTTGVVAPPSYTINKTDGTSYTAVTTVPQAIQNLNTEVLKSLGFIGDSGTKSTRKLGQDLNIKGGATSLSTNNNIGVVSNGSDSLTLRLAKNIDLGSDGSLTTGNTVINNTGVSTPQVVIGTGANTTTLTSNGTSLSVGGDKITNVAAGDISSVSSTDVVNGGQLFTTNSNVTTAQNTANTALTNANNAQTSANTAQSTANTALTEAQKGLNFRANAGASDKVSLGETVTLADGTNTTVTYDAATNTYKYSVVNAPTFSGTVTAANLATGGTLSVTGVSNLNGGANLNNQKITNLADGTVASGSKEAVNGGQLKTVSDVANTASTTANTANTTANTALTNANNAQTSANAAQTTADTALTNANNAQTSANAAQSTANTALTEAQKGINFGDGSTDNNFALGDTINVTGDSNITTETTVDGVQVKLNNDLNVSSVTTGNSKLDSNGLVITGGPSVTTTGINAANTVISNVADGSAPGDAVNFGQLTTTNDNVTAAQNTANTALTNANNAQTTADTALTNANNAQTSANAAQSTANTALTEAQKGINFGDGSTDNNFALGDTINVTGDSNITTETTVDGVQVKLNNDLNVSSVTTGNSKLDSNGLVIIGGPSVTTAGIDAGNKVITNVADGSVASGSKDAVNGGQLFTTNQKVDQNTTNIATNTSNIAKNTGDIATNTANIATNTSNIATNTSNIVTNTSDISTLKGGFNLQTNDTNSGAIKAGDTVDIGVVDPADTNLTATKTGNNVAFALSKDLTLTSVTTGNTVINNAGVTADKVTVGNVVIDKTTNQISGVEAGTNSKDAVNKGQLDALAAQQAASDNAAVKYDD